MNFSIGLAHMMPRDEATKSAEERQLRVDTISFLGCRLCFSGQTRRLM